MTPTTIPSTGERTPAGGGTGTTPPPSWHRDPLQRFALRYWDGEQWTEHVVNAQRQVGIDVAFAHAARAAAATAATAANAATGAAPALAARPEPEPAGAPSPVAAASVSPRVDAEPLAAAPDPPVAPAPAVAPAPPVAPVAAEPPPSPSRRPQLTPSERFDTSPEAVLGRSPRPGVAHPPTAPSAPASADVTATPGSGPGDGVHDGVETREPRDLGASVRRVGATLARIPRSITSGWVATGFAAVAIVAVLAMGLAWASSTRSYRAQESWERRADTWEERAGEHADERDEAIAQVGQTRHRNQALVDDISELEDQIEGLAATNASLVDENQLLREALESLGYQVVR